MNNDDGGGPRPRQEFSLMDGEVRVWIEQEKIFLRAVDQTSQRDPVELTASMARKLATALKLMANETNQ